MNAKTVYITEKDNVAVAIEPIATGSLVIAGDKKVTAVEDIPQGHKIAVEPI